VGAGVAPVAADPHRAAEWCAWPGVARWRAPGRPENRPAWRSAQAAPAGASATTLSGNPTLAPPWFGVGQHAAASAMVTARNRSPPLCRAQLSRRRPWPRIGREVVLDGGLCQGAKEKARARVRHQSMGLGE